jgi:hypothetical protein
MMDNDERGAIGLAKEIEVKKNYVVRVRERTIPTKLGENLSQCHYVHYKSHYLTWARTIASAVGSRRLTT